MNITALTVQNVKRVRAVHIEPSGALIQITGKNAQGKSSVLDSIWYALGGKSGIPDKMIREGEAEARIKVELSNGLTVTRVVKTKADGDEAHSLLVEQDGVSQKSPQGILDKLLGDLTFDPEEFTRMDPKNQLATLKRVCGLDFEELDNNRAHIFAKRTEANRTARDLDGQLKALPDEQAPDEEVSVAELAKEHAEQSQIAIQHLANVNMVGSYQCDIDKLNAKLTELQDLREARAKEVAAYVEVDIDALAEQIDDAENVNRRVRAKKQRRVLAETARFAAAKVDAMTKGIEEIDAEKAALVASATMPIEGLGFGEDGVLMNDLPFENASSSEKLRTSCAIGIATSGDLKIMRIVNGSLLDEDGRGIVADMAEENGMQVFMERVTDGEPVGVVIEDGYVVGQ